MSGVWSVSEILGRTARPLIEIAPVGIQRKQAVSGRRIIYAIFLEIGSYSSAVTARSSGNTALKRGASGLWFFVE